jgi:hypothetical protein
MFCNFYFLEKRKSVHNSITTTTEAREREKKAMRERKNISKDGTIFRKMLTRLTIKTIKFYSGHSATHCRTRLLTSPSNVRLGACYLNNKFFDVKAV